MQLLSAPISNPCLLCLQESIGETMWSESGLPREKLSGNGFIQRISISISITLYGELLSVSVIYKLFAPFYYSKYKYND